MNTFSSRHLFLQIVLWLVYSHVSLADDWRQGASVGGTHMVGWDIEMPLFAGLRVEGSIGIWESKLTTAETIKQYHELGSYNFFYGAGAWQINTLTTDDGYLKNWVRAVIGAEWPLNRYTVWGFELGVNYPKGMAAFWGTQPIESDKKVTLTLPRFYYRWSF